MYKHKKKTKISSLILSQILIVVVIVTSGQFLTTERASAATFTIKTGSYVGDGTDDRSITGIGFQPDMVLLNDDSAAGNNGMIMKTSVMAGELSLAIAETDNPLTTNHIQSLDSDGFTVGDDNDVNSANVMYYYIAVGGSDCSSSGTFCVGSYTGNGGSQTITSVGFQPDMVGVKGNSTNLGVWRSSTMAGNESYYFSNTARIANQRITALNTDGFTVGNNAEVSTNGTDYYYFAFQEVANFFDVGTYTGNGTDGRNIDSSIDANLDFQPDAVFVKSRNNISMVGNVREHYGDRSYLFTDSASAANHIQFLLDPEGFEVGTSTGVNSNGVEYHYVAFGGAGTHNTNKSGTYEMAQGSYAGTGSAFSVTGLPFEPDLVIVKGDTTEYGVFRTSLMAGDRTAYFANASSVFTGGVISLNSDGFSIGTSVETNTAGVDYQWVAFGNASRMDRDGGAADFMVGQYIGTGNDDTVVRDIGFNPDLLVIKRAGGTDGVFRTSNQAGDNTLFFDNTAQQNNRIQALNADGFEKGTNGAVNASGSIYDYFIFENGDRFTTGTYTGSGSAQNVQTVGFQPDFLWIKKISGGTARQGVLRTSEFAADGAFPFLNIGNVIDAIVNLVLDGFALGTGVETNENTFSYQYVAWNNKNYTQQGFRFFENVDSTDVGPPLAAQDTFATLDTQRDPFRLRILMRVDGGNLLESAEEFKLQFAPRVGTCDTGFSGETYQDVTSSSDVAFYDNSAPDTGDGVTPNANDPADGLRTISHQSYNEAAPHLPTIGSTLQGQTAQFGFALIADTAPVGFYCLRMVYQDGAEFESYTSIPEFEVQQEISFDLSDNSIGFGELDPAATRYATGDTLGSTTEQVAHIITASTNAENGYTVQISGTSLTCCAGNGVIQPIGDIAAAATSGLEQFGVRATVLSGTGSIVSPYNTTDWAFDSLNMPDVFVTGLGDNQETEFEARYMTNISQISDAGQYETTITYTMTANY